MRLAHLILFVLFHHALRHGSATELRSIAARPSNDTDLRLITLQGGLMHPAGFYFDATIGGQHLKLQFDTSYSSIIVPRKECDGCRVGDRRYDPTASVTADRVSCTDERCEREKCSLIDGCHQCSEWGACCTSDGSACAFNMQYGDKTSGNGSLYYDTVQFADGLKATVPIGVIHEESRNFEHAYVDGTFGIAFEKGACHPGCTPPVMDFVRNQTGVGDVFTFCASAFGGRLAVGNRAATLLATEPYQYVGVIDLAREERFVVRALPRWNVGGIEINLPGITQAMVAATTSSIAVGTGTMQALQMHFMQHYCDVPKLCSFNSWFKPQRCVHIDDVDFRRLPNITIPLGHHVSLTITPDDYVPKYRVIQGKLLRCVAFHIADHLAARGIGLVLGASILRRYTAVFDRKRRRVGFAPSNTLECGPTNGSTRGLAGVAGAGLEANLSVLTATSPSSALSPGLLRNSSIGKALLHAEQCRALRGCSQCARADGCYYWYTTGRCVVAEHASGFLYPFCSGLACACWSVGGSGWYFGLAIGVLTALALIVAGLLMYSKRQRRYQQLATLDDEQDMETF